LLTQNLRAFASTAVGRHYAIDALFSLTQYLTS
jgi:hypothetical protein